MSNSLSLSDTDLKTITNCSEKTDIDTSMKGVIDRNWGKVGLKTTENRYDLLRKVYDSFETPLRSGYVRRAAEILRILNLHSTYYEEVSIKCAYSRYVSTAPYNVNLLT